MPTPIEPLPTKNPPLPRPAGAPMIVVMARASVTTRYFKVVEDRDAGDGLVRIWPLDRDDDREPFWIGADQLREVPGAYVETGTGWLRIPTRMIEE